MSSHTAATKPYTATQSYAATQRERFEADLAQAPRYPTVFDLVEVLGGGASGRDRLVDAFVQGWLSVEHQHLLEERAALLQCWLLARLVRLALPGGGS